MNDRPGQTDNLVLDIESSTLKNTAYRHVIKTAPYSQYVLMSLLPKQEIGMEVHEDGDQFIRVEGGQGLAILDNKVYDLSDGIAVIIPAGTHHNIINTSDTEPLKLYTIYSPPHHPRGTLQWTKVDWLG